MTRRHGILLAIGPGLLVAATGVGAGDLAGAALAGNRVGVAVLWAVVVGAAMKYVLNEGIARWQLATNTTLVDGALRRAPRAVGIAFLLYFAVWTFLVAAALMSACGVAGHALLPLLEDPARDKIAYGILHSLAGVALVKAGGFPLFERVMSAAVVILVAVVVWTCAQLLPDTEGVLRGLLVPSIPDAGGQGLAWTVALMGGVGGTVTVLCYGYWIRETGRTSVEDLPRSRLDLALAYGMTALFGICMVVIGSAVEVEGRGATLIVRLGERLGETLGPGARVAFLVGAWCAIASSLLGVWQSVPYLYADIVAAIRREEPDAAAARAASRYDAWLLLLATVPMVGLWLGFARLQKTYAVCGALFMPVLALALLSLNRRADLLGRLRSGRATALALASVLAFFGWLAVREVVS